MAGHHTRLDSGRLAGRSGCLSLICLYYCLGILWALTEALPAYGTNADGSDRIAPAATFGKRRETRIETPTEDQLTASESAKNSGIKVQWHSRLGTPASVRGKGIGRRGAFSGGKGLAMRGGGAFESDAVAVLDNVARIFRIRDAEKEFKSRRTDADTMGFHHARMRQMFQGLPVVGGDLIVHFNDRGEAYEVNGAYVPGIDVGTTPVLAGAEAVNFAAADLAGMKKPAGTLTEGPTLCVFALNADPTLAYQITLSYADAKNEPGRWRYWIDAATGAILFRYNDIPKIAQPTTNGAPATITGYILAGEGGANANVSGWHENTGYYYLHNTGRRWQVYNVASSGWPDNNTYAYRTTNDWGTSDLAAMSLACGFDRVQEYYLNVHGRHSFNDANIYARANVHQGVNYVNAYWDGMDFHFGDGNGVIANSLAVLDVAAHEFTHAVDEYTANLIYANEPGALNESFSDIFGVCVEFYAQPDGRALYPNKSPGTADWLCGEDCWLSSTALRDLRCPSNTATVGAGNEQPTRYKGKYWDPGGEVHQNDGVQNFFFYLLCEGGSGINDGIVYSVTGIGITNGAQVAFRALTVYCVPSTDYRAVRDAWISAAEDLNTDWVGSVEQAWAAVGISALTITPQNGVVFRGLFGGPFTPASQSFTVSNGSAEAMSWAAWPAEIWSDIWPSNGTLAAGSQTNVTIQINAAANGLSLGTYTNWITFSNSLESALQVRSVALRVGVGDDFTELFSGSDNDLNYRMLTFRSDGSPSFYAAYCNPATNFPTDPTGGHILDLDDDSYAQITLSGWHQVSLYGMVRNTLFVGSNGYITFGDGDDEYDETLEDHFDLPRISALFDDLHPYENVSWKELSDRVVVTFLNVEEYDEGNYNSFQFELFYDGTIRITYLQIDAVDGLAGLSQGLGIPADFVESDLSFYPPVPPPDALAVTPAEGMSSRGYEGGPFIPSSKVYTLENIGSNAIGWAVTGTATWLWLDATPSSGTLATGETSQVTVALNSEPDGLTPGVYTNLLKFSNTVSGVAQTRMAVLRVGLATDYFTELFSSSDNDLGYKMLTFRPDGSQRFYVVYCDPAMNFPTDPTGGQLLDLWDDDYAQITLSGGRQVSLYGVVRNTLFVGSNGYITFDEGDDEYDESLADHFDLPRISALFYDLYPYDNVSWKELPDRVAVTFLNVEEYWEEENNDSFQFELFYDGTIRITYLQIDAAKGLAGLSQGLGIPADFVESDLSSYPPAPPDALAVTPAEGMSSRGYEGGPFIPSSKVYTLENIGSNAIGWAVTGTATWLDATPSSGTLATGETAEVTVALNSEPDGLTPGVYTSLLRFSNTVSGVAQTRMAVLCVRLAVDYFTELFSSYDNDLDYKILTFRPDDSQRFYVAYCDTATNFPTDPAGGTILDLGDDDYYQITLSGGHQVSLYGVVRNKLFVGSNGYITFDEGDYEYYESLADHFDLPRISGLFDDLYPDGNISWKELPDRVAVTFLNVEEYWEEENNNSFQFELFYDGTIRITYLQIDTVEGLAGLSQGLGIPADFVESDLSAYPPAQPPDTLTVTPSDGMSSAGYVGGPFTPSNKVYILENIGSNTIGWTVSRTATWLDATPLSGTLATGETAEVTAALNSEPNGLAPGVYTNRMTFSNTVSGATRTRVVVLKVLPIPGQIEVWDSIAPNDDTNMPFGPLLVGLSRTESITVTNTDPVHNLVISAILGGGYQENFEDGLAQDWAPSDPSYWAVASGEYVAQGTAGGWRLSAYTGERWRDAAAQMTVRRTGAVGYSAVLFFRATDNFVVDVSGSAYGVGLADRQFWIGKWVGGRFSWLSLWESSPYLYPDSGTNIVVASYQSNFIAIYFNGNMAWTGTDSSITGPGRIALAGFSGGSTIHYFDNVVVGDLIMGGVGGASVQTTMAGLAADIRRAPAIASVRTPSISQGMPSVVWQVEPAFRLVGVPALPYAILPGSNLTFEVVYGPLSVNLNTSTVVIVSNDAEEPEVWVKLSGLGIADYLGIAPGSDLVSSGHPGGPFEPSNQVYQLTNYGLAAFEWNARSTQAWVTVSPAAGTLAAGESTLVNVSLNEAASLLGVGTYGDTVTFSNVTSAFVETRDVALTVFTTPQLTYAPASFCVTNKQGYSTNAFLNIGNAAGADADLTFQLNNLHLSYTSAWTMAVRGVGPAEAGRRDFTRAASGASYVKGRLLARFAAGVQGAQRTATLAALGGSAVVKEYPIVPGLCLVKLGPAMTVEAALPVFNGAPGILYAEPDYQQEIVLTPNDARYGELWGMHNTGQTGGTPDADIDAPEAWDLATGSRDIVVAVIDTGVDYNHEDLAANMWQNPGEIPGNGLDDDGNGYIDDVYGINAITGSGNPLDDHNHGTHCAGTIGGLGNNTVGVAGVCWQVRIMALKFLSSGGSGNISDAIECVQYGVQKAARVMSNSWGGGGYSQAMKDAIDAAGAAGIVFVAAAGNDGQNTDNSPFYPSCYTSANLIAVMATDHNDSRAGFSNYGQQTVDLGAPGVNILSCKRGGGYMTMSGTSMATPHVAGACGLMLSVNPMLNVLDLKAVLIATVDPTLAGQCVAGGRMNVARAVSQVGPEWLTVTPSAATNIAPGSATNVVVGFNGAVAPGRYEGQIVIECNDRAVPATNVPCTMVVLPDPLNVAPLTGLVSTGYTGGPFTTSNIVYTLTNSGDEAVAWMSGWTQAWVSVTPNSGTLGAGEAVYVAVSLTAQASLLPAGIYRDTVVLSNLTSGIRHSRNVQLVVRERLLAGFAWDEIAPTQHVGVAFPVAIRAVDQTGLICSGFTNSASLKSMCTSAAARIVFRADFETGLDGFEINNLRGTPLWHRSIGRALNPGHSPSISMYYGRNEGPDGGGDYDAGNTEGLIVSPLIDLTAVSGSIELSFNYLLGTENYASYDQATVEVRKEGAAAASIVASNNRGGVPIVDPTLVWLSTSVDLSAYTNSRIYLAFRFKTLDDISNEYEGWYVDDVMVVAHPSIVPTNTGNFAGGVWTGSVMVLEPATNIFLRASYGSAKGDSNPFDVALDTLGVTPMDGLVFSGYQGGPFGSANKTYTLTNMAGVNLPWTAGCAANWVTVAPAGGTLEIDAVTNVNVSINATADGLIAGAYTDTVLFSNAVSGVAHTRPVQLTISDSLRVTPTNGLVAIGYTMGPIMPSNIVYTLTNSGNLAINWGCAHTQTWVSITPESGTLGIGESVGVLVAFNANAIGLPLGTYADVVSFTNAAGSVAYARPVQLNIVEGPPGIGYAPSSLSFTGEIYRALGAQTLTVSNAGTGQLNYTIGSDVFWLTVSNTAGALSAGASTAHTVRVATRGLAPRKYTGHLTIADPMATNSAQTVVVEIELNSAVPPNLAFAWGYNEYGQTNVPKGLINPVAVAGGGNHSLALLADGRVVAWGNNGSGQTNVPAGLTNALAVAAGEDHSLALLADGRVVAWGYNGHGETSVPADLSNAVAVAAGWNHSLALRADGRVVAWGHNVYGQVGVPAGLTNAVAVGGGGFHSLALCADGRVVAWGYNGHGETSVPVDLCNAVAMAAGGYHSLALRADGRVVAWGHNVYGQVGVPAGLTNAVAVAGGGSHSLALCEDGRVVAWGRNNYGQTTVPVDLTNAVAVAAGMNHSLAVAPALTLVVASEHGTPTPPRGTNAVLPGTVQRCWVDSSLQYGWTQYVCEGWAGSGSVPAIGPSHEVSFVITNDSTITWQWATKYWLATATNGNGTVTAADGWYVTGSSTALTATAGANWHFTGWSGDTNACPAAGGVITAQMTQARAITANFAIDQKTLTVVSAHGGAYPGTQIADYNTALSQFITNSPVSGGVGTQYMCVAGAVAGNAYTPVSSTNVTLTLTNDATLTWNWQTQYRLTTATNGNGMVTAADGWYATGSITALTATAGANWHFTGWSGDTNGCGIVGNVITAQMTQARSITANFAIDQKTLTVVSAQGGAYPGTQSTNYDTALAQFITNSPVADGAGTQYVCTAGAVAGNAFEPVSPTNVTLTLTNNAILTWQWQTQYRLTTATNGNGTVTAADGFYATGSITALTATAGANWHFTGWSGDTNGCGIVGNVITAAMTQARSITANFAIDQKTLTVVSAQGGAYPGTQIADYDTALAQLITNSPVAAGAGTQYVCVAGTVAGNAYTPVSPTNVTLTLTNNATLTWQWQTQYRLTTATNGNGTVTVADGWYATGSSTALTAVAGANWHFTGWSGNTDGCAVVGTVITAAMTQVRSITANFAIDQKILTVVSAQGGAYPGTQIADYNAALAQFITNSPVSGGVGTQYMCVAGTVAGNAYTPVSPTNVTLTLTNNATLTWQWQTQYRLTTATNGNGTVTAADGFYATGSSTTLTAVAGANWHFTGWSGNTDGCAVVGTVITAAMTQVRAITANFLPVISVTPSSCDFGSVQVGSGSRRTFTVQNIGTGTLAGVASVGAPFSVLPPSNYNLSAGQSQVVTVRFRPLAAVTYSNNVNFTGEGGATRLVTGLGTKGDQTITFTDPGEQLRAARVILQAQASSGLPVKFVVLSGPGLITASKNLSFTGIGEVSIAARQSGNTNWNAAPQVVVTINVINPAMNDYDGDGISDLALYTAAGGGWNIKYSGGGTTNVNWGFQNSTTVCGDYDGDGKADLAVFYNVTGRWYVRTIDGRVLAYNFAWGWPSAKTVSGDYDGDGRDDLAVYDENTGKWYIWSLAKNRMVAWNLAWGWPGAKPVSGDYDGDRKSDLAVLDVNIGHWYIYSLATEKAVAWDVAWGWTGCAYIPGDFDGDGKSDLAVCDQATHTQLWYIYSLAAGKALAWNLNWGLAGGIPVSGDYDGDGKTDFAIYDQNYGKWYIRNLVGDLLMLDQVFGGGAAVPVKP